MQKIYHYLFAILILLIQSTYPMYHSSKSKNNSDTGRIAVIIGGFLTGSFLAGVFVWKAVSHYKNRQNQEICAKLDNHAAPAALDIKSHHEIWREVELQQELEFKKLLETTRDITGLICDSGSLDGKPTYDKDELLKQLDLVQDAPTLKLFIETNLLERNHNSTPPPATGSAENPIII